MAFAATYLLSALAAEPVVGGTLPVLQLISTLQLQSAVALLFAVERWSMCDMTFLLRHGVIEWPGINLA